MIYIYVRVCTLDQEMMDISKIATSFLSFLTDVFFFFHEPFVPVFILFSVIKCVLGACLCGESINIFDINANFNLCIFVIY